MGIPLEENSPILQYNFRNSHFGTFSEFPAYFRRYIKWFAKLKLASDQVELLPVEDHNFKVKNLILSKMASKIAIVFALFCLVCIGMSEGFIHHPPHQPIRRPTFPIPTTPPFNPYPRPAPVWNRFRREAPDFVVPAENAEGPYQVVYEYYED
ncbi:unnamed protein product [Hermetia illucens]|uniref:Uncharacterized protein n=1 Tax=Hermetia illucens TaxID=343691 RepID=A0A7R8UAL5_HERIL|nr:unnamed protein product [Hermetia illucens]